MAALRSLVDSITDRLRNAGCVAAEEEADELVAGAPDEDTLDVWVGRRERGEPLAWITGAMQFCGRRIRVDPGVYVPRVQSEHLARRAAALLVAAGDGAAAVDLCTGTGAIAAHLRAEASAAAVIGVDIDRQAAACARRNGVPTVVGDLDRCLRPNRFDVVTAVAPYVPTSGLRLLPADVQRHEPRLALDGGTDGLGLVRRIVVAAERLLRPGGWLLVELGGDQDEVLGPTLATHCFSPGDPWFDEDGDLRGLATQAGGHGSVLEPAVSYRRAPRTRPAASLTTCEGPPSFQAAARRAPLPASTEPEREWA